MPRAAGNLKVHIRRTAHGAAGTFVGQSAAGWAAFLQDLAAVGAVFPLLKRDPEQGALADGIGNI